MSDETDLPDDDFEAMLEESFRKRSEPLRVGQKVRARLIQIGRQSLILDLGEGREGLMDPAELEDADEELDLREGESFDGWVLRVRDGIAEVGLSLERAQQGRAGLEEAMRSGLPVKGRVVEVNKGGYVVEAGGARCFCPLGAMDVRFGEDPQTFVGQSLSFRVTEMRGARDVVLSRRALLEEQAEEAAAATRERLEVGARFRGTVTNVREFGAFVDLGGIEGLVPASELGFHRSRPEDELQSGQPLDVEVIRMETDDKGRERITLSVKALLDDPFDAVAAELSPGVVLLGRVSRLKDFGAFVELVPGVDGLLHVSAFGRRIGSPAEVVAPGQDVTVRVKDVDVDKRRIALQWEESDDAGAARPAPSPSGLLVLRRAEVSAVGSEAPASSSAKVGDVHEVTVERVARFGVFVTWDGGRGLVLGKELGIPRDSDPGKPYPVGTSFRAAITEIRDDGKINLSKLAVERADEQADAEAYRAKTQSTPGLGTIGDLLKARKRD